MTSQPYSMPYGRAGASAIYTDAMSRMYGLVALGVVTTAAAIWIGDAIGVGEVIFGLGWISMLLAFGVMFGTLYAAGRGRPEGQHWPRHRPLPRLHRHGGPVPLPHSDRLHERDDRGRLPTDAPASSSP